MSDVRECTETLSEKFLDGVSWSGKSEPLTIRCLLPLGHNGPHAARDDEGSVVRF